MTTTVRQMLRNKPGVFAVRQDDTVYDALALMAEHNIGSVLVMDGPELRGGKGVEARRHEGLRHRLVRA